MALLRALHVRGLSGLHRVLQEFRFIGVVF